MAGGVTARSSPVELGPQRRAAPAGARRADAALPRAAAGSSRTLEPPPKLEERGADAGRSGGGHRQLGCPRVGRQGADRLPRLDRDGRRRPPDAPRSAALRTSRSPTRWTPTCARASRPTACSIPAVVSPSPGRARRARPGARRDVDGEPLVFRVAAVAQRFPGRPAERARPTSWSSTGATLETALNTAAPGAGFRPRLWLERRARPPGSGGGSTAQAAVHGARDRPRRRALERSLKPEPVARGPRSRCWRRLALIGDRARAARLVLGARSASGATRRRSSFDLEAQGTRPRACAGSCGCARSSWRDWPASIGGIVTGVVLSLLVVSFVELTANATAPTPPLALSLDWAAVAVLGAGRGGCGRHCSSGSPPGAPSASPVPARYGGGG